MFAVAFAVSGTYAICSFRLIRYDLFYISVQQFFLSMHTIGVLTCVMRVSCDFLVCCYKKYLQAVESKPIIQNKP